jgi:hypothetical protein
MEDVATTIYSALGIDWSKVIEAAPSGPLHRTVRVEADDQEPGDLDLVDPIDDQRRRISPDCKSRDYQKSIPAPVTSRAGGSTPRQVAADARERATHRDH